MSNQIITHAEEKNRHLHLTVGGTEEFIIPPIPSAAGAGIFTMWFGIRMGAVTDPLTSAAQMSMLAVGQDNWARIQELRAAEAEVVIQAATFWNMQGGGFDVVTALLEDGHPKAAELVEERTGVSQTMEPLKAFLSGESASPTPTDDTPATSTQPGI